MIKTVKAKPGLRTKSQIKILFAKKEKTVLPLREIFWEVMFAIVSIAGQQFKVKQNDELFVHRLNGNAGDKVEFSEVLMSSNDGNISMGSQVKVQAEIMDHLKGDKVIVFKKKRRKGYQKLNGHRQYLTKIKINTIA
jgi:large subunit ribosomal protein L21